MDRRVIYLIVAVIVVVAIGVIGFLVFSNVRLSAGTAQFSPGSNGLNTLQITGPYGWYCMEYEKIPTDVNSPTLGLGGRGISACPMFGASINGSTDFPDGRVTQTIPLEQDVMVYQNPNKTFEIYVWVTRDRANFDRLDQIIASQNK